tara:strand:- start:193 stop:399 length:207 start_codon:yes stop_codon:yes gene_type:complete
LFISFSIKPFPGSLSILLLLAQALGRFKYFPSNVGSKCSYRTLDEKEKTSLKLKAFKTFVGIEGDMET